MLNWGRGQSNIMKRITFMDDRGNSGCCWLAGGFYSTLKRHVFGPMDSFFLFLVGREGKWARRHQMYHYSYFLFFFGWLVIKYILRQNKLIQWRQSHPMISMKRVLKSMVVTCQHRSDSNSDSILILIPHQKARRYFDNIGKTMVIDLIISMYYCSCCLL